MYDKDDLIQHLNPMLNMPIRILRVDNERTDDFRIEGIEVINNEICLIIDNYQES